MKNPIIAVILLQIFNAVPAFSQPAFQNDFKGTWYTGVYKDTMKLSFIDSNRIFADLDPHDRMQGEYRFNILRNKIILRIWPVDKKRQDTLIFIMTKLNDGEYKIESLTHLYFDRPPESLLDERTSYILRKLGTM